MIESLSFRLGPFRFYGDVYEGEWLVQGWINDMQCIELQLPLELDEQRLEFECEKAAWRKLEEWHDKVGDMYVARRTERELKDGKHNENDSVPLS